MREIRLLVYFLIGLLISINSVLAYAVDLCDPDTPAWRTSAGGVYYGSTKQAACSKMASLMGVPYKMGVSYGEDICTYNNQGWSFNQIMICDDGNLPNSAGKCTCNPCKSKTGMWDNGGSPQSVNLPGPLPFYSGETNGKAEMPSTICLNGCVADTTQDRGDGMATSSWWGYTMNPKYNGQSCSPGTPKPGISKPKDSPEKKCVDQGMGFGYVNDKVLCVKPDNSSGTAKKSTETKNPDGTTTKVDTTTNISCNAEGACSTTTTTTTTVINADGSTASTKTETKKEDSQGNTGTGTADGTGFCKENPTSPMCKSGSFTGTCAQEPVCEGDPIQCATAKATFKTQCALVASQEVADKGKSYIEGTDQETKDALKRNEITIPQINSSDTGGGSCPADRQIEIADKYVTIPYSSICGAMAIMKVALLAIATFSAAMIVMGGVK